MNPLLLLALLITPATSPSAITPRPTTDNLEEIQKIRQAVQEKVKEKIKEITQTIPTKRGVIGELINLKDNLLVLEYENQTQEISFDDNTVIIDAKRNKTKSSNIKVGQGILALGLTNQENNNLLEAKRLVFIDLSLVNNPQQIIAGQIIDVSKTLPVFTLIPNTDKDKQLQIKTDPKTKVVDRKENALDSKNLKSGDKVIILYKPDPKNPKTILAIKIITILSPAPTPTPKPTGN